MTGNFLKFSGGAYAVRGGGGGKKERKFQTQASSRPYHAQCGALGASLSVASHWLTLAHQHAQIAPIGPALARIQSIGSTHSAQRQAASGRQAQCGPIKHGQARSARPFSTMPYNGPALARIGHHIDPHWAVTLEPLNASRPTKKRSRLGYDWMRMDTATRIRSEAEMLLAHPSHTMTLPNIPLIPYHLFLSLRVCVSEVFRGVVLLQSCPQS